MSGHLHVWFGTYKMMDDSVLVRYEKKLIQKPIRPQAHQFETVVHHLRSIILGPYRFHKGPIGEKTFFRHSELLH